jgi:hypothetical protein
VSGHDESDFGGTDSRRPRDAGPGRARGQRDAYAQSVLDARLGRPARDVLEATVVLEAWTGRPAKDAMRSASDLVRLDGPPVKALSRVDPFADSERTSVIAEGVTLVLLIVSIAAWAAPISRALGTDVLGHAIRVALPIAVAIQWGLRSRYLGRPLGLACLARDGLWFWALLLVAIDVPLLFQSGWGPVAAMLIPIWVGGAVLTRRGWGLIYAAVLVVATFALSDGVEPYVVLGALTALTLAMCGAAVYSRRQQTDARAGTVGRALMAALIGGLMGILLVADPTLSWGVHGAHPAVALIPSVIGSYWGGYYLWNFYDAIPRGLRGVSLERAGGIGFSDPAMAIFVGALARLIGATAVLSAVVIALSDHFGGTDDVSVFIAFGCVGTVSMLIGLLESFALQWAALLAAGAALATELVCVSLSLTPSAGGALAAGATVGVLVTLPVLLVRLARSGRVLATTLWIQ